MIRFDLEEAARQYRAIQAQQDSLKLQAEALREQMITAMEGQEVVRAGVFTLRYRPVTSSRVDTAALKKTMPDLAAEFTTVGTSWRFTVT